MAESAFFAVLAVLAWAAAVRVTRRARLRYKRGRDPFRKVLFLDFDGVLHGGFGENFEHREEFEAVLKSHPDASVVISSDWRCGRTLDELASIFSAEVREQFIGVTPELSPVDRLLEIEAYYATHNVWSYLVLDDSRAVFPRHSPHVSFIGHRTGLTPTDLDYIDHWLRMT